MKLEIIKPIGLCNSAQKILNEVNKYLNKYMNIYILGEILHNEYVINELSNKGIKFVKDLKTIEKNKYTLVVLPSHGTSPLVYEKLSGYNYIDLTCPKIKKMQDFVLDNTDKDILFLGKKGHSESLAFVGYPNVTMIHSVSDVDNLKSDLKDPILMCQTTFTEQLFVEVAEKLEEKYPNIVIKNTLCNIPLERIKNINSSKADMLLVIGSKTSSNANELKNSKTNSKIVSYKTDINIEELLKYDTVAIASASSTPIEQVNIIVDAIKNATSK